MVIGTISSLCAVLSVITKFYLIILRMIFKFFPSMAKITHEFVRTSILIVSDKICRFPVCAWKWFICHDIRLSSVILPIMSINTQGLVVLRKIKGAPNSLKIEHIEIIIVFHIMNEFNQNIHFRVSKRAKNSIITVQ